MYAAGLPRLCMEYFAGAAAGLREDASCPICMECFTDPVTIECGHSYCLSCLSRYMQQSELVISCPRCRQRFTPGNLKPDKGLAAIAEVFQQLQAAHSPQKSHCQSLCQRCPVCWESPGPGRHSAAPAAEGFKGCKPGLQKCLAALQEALEEILKQKLSEEENAGCCQNEFKSQREKIKFEFLGLQQFLKEEECLLLSKLDEEENRTLKNIQVKVQKLEEKSSSLGKLIKELEKESQQPDGSLLLSVSRPFMNRCRVVDVQNPEDESLERQKGVQNVCQQHVHLQKMVADFKEWRLARRHAVDVTLAPETAHPYLVLSEDCKGVRDGDTKQDVPKSLERFDHYTVVLGCERFTSGRHYWEVEVGHKSDWGLGVCNESASRKGRITLLPEEGFWVVRLRDGGDYSALTSRITQIKPRTALRAVGIFLDYEAGKVSFYNAEENSHLFTFQDTFTQALRPLFSPGVVDKGRNAGALRIRLVTRW
ncbi:E3 ubiquitin-protein ligase TRIM39-like [Ambystoma mexicanum]|uniref:E3 ubiquitin-protein ligase TRIM39-like n=1 Tax=Ambystoma mexicanum TaxID=8296 RepID=UPI0037E7AA4D